MQKIASLGTESLSFGLRLAANILSYELTETTILLIDPHAERLHRTSYVIASILVGDALEPQAFGN